MPARARSLLIFLVLLLPSLRFAWRHADMPEFGYLHDDGIQYESAKSLAQGTGYRIPSLPENPAQTKYPPFFPLFLSMVWRINPVFPANLRLASFCCWAALVMLLALSWLLEESARFPRWRIYVVTLLLAVNPYMILFGTTPFSEVLFCCFVLATLLLIEKEGVDWVVAAGLMASIAYLTRTAGIALLISVPAWFIWRRKKRDAMIFAASMLPGVAGWSLWSRSVMAHGDNTLTYYVDYIRYQFLNVGLDNIGVVLWKNLDQTLYGMGALFLPKVLDISALKILTQVLAIAAIVGVVRLVRRGVMVPYALFAAVSVVILLLWHFPPNERFVLPLFPLLAMGFVEEMTQLFTNIRAGLRHKDSSQRIAGRVFGGTVVLLLSAVAAVQMFVTFSYLDQSTDQKQAKLEDLKQAYAWISTHVPVSAKILSYDDTLMYLYTGREGNYLPLLPRLWYAEDHAAMIQAYKDLPQYCRSRRLAYVYFTTDDPGREVGDDDREKIVAAVQANHELVPLFHAGIGTVYRVATSAPQE